MITVRKAGERGRSRTDWLDSRHTFSFADYLDTRHMGFAKLRVINDDVVEPGHGFGRHPHRDMEILSYVVEGSLAHADSMGNGSVIVPGDVQRMTAGTGVLHSEQNPSKERRVRFLQIWIEPDRRGLDPGYEQRHFEAAPGSLRLVASHDGRDGSVSVHQDVSVYAGVIGSGQHATVPVAAGRRGWVQIVRGEALLNGVPLSQGDGAALERESAMRVEGRGAETEVLVFDLA